MMKPNDERQFAENIETIRANSRDEWRKWLEENCQTKKTVLLIIYHQNSRTTSVHFQEAIEEAVCFGWVDSKAHRRDAESFYLRFSPRNPKSSWGKASKERAERMMQQGRMAPPGQAIIDEAKETGMWQALDDAHHLIVPPDLQAELDRHELAGKNFQAFSPASKRRILEWISKAKREETRRRRITQTAELAARNIQANQ